MKTKFLCALAFVVISSGALFAGAQPSQDVLLTALQAEMARSVAGLRLPGAQAPYYIEYRVLDTDSCSLSAAFGALTREQRTRTRLLQATVRVGSYGQDSSIPFAGAGTALLPYEDDVYALRRVIWLATDRAYKQAITTLAMKQALLRRYQVQPQADDFSREAPADYIEPLARIDFGAEDWSKVVASLSALYREDPQLRSFTATLGFSAVNEYLLNSEGTVLRKGHSIYSIAVSGRSQAPDGMELSRSYGELTPTLTEFPSAAKMTAKTREILAQLRALQSAPVVSGEYDGPVVLQNKAADLALADLVGKNVVAIPPQPGSPARTAGAYASSYQSRVLPAFVSVIDDPTLEIYKGEGLPSHYAYDDEGVKAEKLEVIESGKLVNYLTSRQPVRDFPHSNGHGRIQSSPYGAFLAASPSTLIAASSRPVSFTALKQKLLALCKEQGLEYGYLVEEMAPGAAQNPETENSEPGGYSPQLLYRVYVSDGHRELVRGADLSALDTRSLRDNLIAMGDDPFLEGAGDESAPIGVISPSMLFSNLEIKPTSAGKDKLPQYPAPEIAANRAGR